MSRSPRLGSVQLEVLKGLKRHEGFWNPRCGWIWSTQSGTLKIFLALTKKGYVTQAGDTFTLTKAGFNAIFRNGG